MDVASQHLISWWDLTLYDILDPAWCAMRARVHISYYCVHTHTTSSPQCAGCSGHSVLSTDCCTGETEEGTESAGYGENSGQSSRPYDTSKVSVCREYSLLICTKLSTGHSLLSGF